MNSRSAKRKRRLLILRNQNGGAPGVYPKISNGCSDDRDLVEEFRIACGARGLPRLSVGRADHAARDCFVLEKPYAILGQSRESDIRLDDSGVSFRHAYLQVVNGRLLCVDLVSNTGTYIGGSPRHAAWLNAGATASIGPYVLHHLGDQQNVFGDEEPCDPHPHSDRSTLAVPNLLRPDEPRDRPALLPNASLVFLNARRESSGQKVRRINRAVTLVGKSRACKVTLVDKTVSRVHCSFVLTPHGLWIVDLLGRGGTRVNGDVIEHQRLADGSEIRVGRFRFGVRYETGESPQPWAVPMQPLSGFSSSPTDEASRVVSAESAIVIADEGSAAGTSPVAFRASPATKTDSATGRVPNSLLAEPETKNPAVTAANDAAVNDAEPSGRFSEEFVRSLVGQFAVMQQQMIDQTQQQMAMLTQMFGAMYQSQQDLIRDELRQIHTLTAEIQHIQSRLVEQQMTAATAETPIPQSPEVVQGKGLTAEPGPLLPDPAEDLSEDLPRDRLQTQGEEQPLSEAEAESPAVQPETAPPTDVAESSAAAGRIPDDAPDSVEGSPRSRADVDTHAWLTERIGQLERERSSRWKKVLQTLSGSGSSSRS